MSHAVQTGSTNYIKTIHIDAYHIPQNLTNHGYLSSQMVSLECTYSRQ